MRPDEGTIGWLFDTTAWWVGSFGGFEALAAQGLPAPVDEDFPVDPELEGVDLARDFFAFVVEHAGVSDWPLVAEPVEPPSVADALVGMPHHMTEAPAPANDRRGGELAEGEPLVVPFDPAQVADPTALVATMARGVSHYILFSGHPERPFAEESWEHAVDLGAVLLGFGIFVANSAFEFQQHQSGPMIGWGYARQGALSQLDVSYALAMYTTLLDIDDREVTEHLAPNPRGWFRDARRDLRRRDRDLARIRAITTAQGPYR